MPTNPRKTLIPMMILMLIDMNSDTFAKKTKKTVFQLIQVLYSVLLGISLFSIKNRIKCVISVIAACSVLLIPVMLKEKISGFSVHQKLMLFCASPALIQLIEYLVTGDTLCLVVFLLLGIVFVFEWKFKVISDRWKP